MTEPQPQLDPARQQRPTSLDQALNLVQDLQRDLDQVRNEVNWSNRLTTLGTLAAVLAHEYNNLLTPIGSYAQLALNEPGNAELREKALKSAVQGVAQAKAIAEATLALASPETQAADGGCVLGEVLRRAVDCTGPALARGRVELETRVDETELAIGGVPLQQVLVNLICNASKAMRDLPGKRRLMITSEVVGGHCHVVVTDTGPGIPESILHEVFEPFVTQGSRADSVDEQGTGLGLSICRNLIEAAGGTISASNLPGRGARFELVLPTAGPDPV